MSKLEEIISRTAGGAINRGTSRQQIKDLMFELMQHVHSYVNPSQRSQVWLNEAELHQLVDEL